MPVIRKVKTVKTTTSGMHSHYFMVAAQFAAAQVGRVYSLEPLKSVGQFLRAQNTDYYVSPVKGELQSKIVHREN
jgi:hypothetical protein